jgi:ABC-2 type transport system ATP-binding protein
VPTGVWIVIAIAVVLVVATLIDIVRHDVQHLPRWVWALIVVFGSFPLGAIVYLVVGRAPREHAGSGTEAGAATGQRPSAAVDAARSVPMSTGRVSDWPGPVPLVIETRGLSKIYGDTAALDGVDLIVPRGSTYGLIGPNGSGKTTMLSILAGLRRPTSGDVELAVDRQRMGLLVDTPLFEPWLSAREVVDLARHLTAPDEPAERVTDVLVEVGLGDAIDRTTGGFSRGMLQRLGLAACLVGDPEVLVLDEPSSALDPSGRREVLDIVGRLAQTKTVLLSTHILADVQQVCDTVGVIDHGRLLYQGPIGELLARTSSAFVLHVRQPPRELAATLAECAWADEVRELAPGRFRLVVSDATAAELEVPAVLAARRVALVSFNPATDLESAFLELTT